MTIKELIEKLKEFDSEREILVYGDRDSSSEAIASVEEINGNEVISQVFK